MKIKKSLNQFEKEGVILAVAGEKKAKFYLAGAGEINLVGEVEELTPKYSDNEGFFGGKKGGKLSRMGNPSVEVKKEYLLEKFTSKFSAEVLAIENGGSLPIYLFAPSIVHNMLAGSLPKALAKRIKLIISGNHLHATPFELLEKIAKKIPSGAPVTNEKARKLLRK